MPHQGGSRGEDLARDYYETSDVDTFYAHVWGGEDIHTGIYTQAGEAIADASRRTVERVADKVADLLTPEAAVLDMGSGYGGPARYLAATFGCRITALNISESQNRRHRAVNTERGLHAGLGLPHVDFDDRSDQITTHYERLIEETHKREQELRAVISPGYVDTLLNSLSLWVDAAHQGQLRWGIFHCRRA